MTDNTGGKASSSDGRRRGYASIILLECEGWKCESSRGQAGKPRPWADRGSFFRPSLGQKSSVLECHSSQICKPLLLCVLRQTRFQVSARSPPDRGTSGRDLPCNFHHYRTDKV